MLGDRLLSLGCRGNNSFGSCSLLPILTGAGTSVPACCTCGGEQGLGMLGGGGGEEAWCLCIRKQVVDLSSFHVLLPSLRCQQLWGQPGRG